MIVNEVSIPLSEYCKVIGRIERFADRYSATLSWTGEFFAGEEIIATIWKTDSYSEAYSELMRMIASMVDRISDFQNEAIRFSEGDNKGD